MIKKKEKSYERSTQALEQKDHGGNIKSKTCHQRWKKKLSSQNMLV